MDTSAFGILTSISVPHILEEIFFSLDYVTFKSCMQVNTVWRNLLRSEQYQSRAKSKYDEEIERELMMASSTGHLKRVKLILSIFMVDIDYIGKIQVRTRLVDRIYTVHQPTFLCQASLGGHIDVVNFLLNKGANPNKTAPLKWATMAGHTHVVKLLLKRGSNPNKRFQLFGNSGTTSLHTAAYRGYVDVVQLLVDHGSALDLEDEHGCSPLFYASLNGHKKVVEILINEGASLTISTTGGWAALHAAAWMGRKDVVKLLLKYGANPKYENNKGKNALALASQKGYEDIIMILAPVS